MGMESSRHAAVSHTRRLLMVRMNVSNNQVDLELGEQMKQQVFRSACLGAMILPILIACTKEASDFPSIEIHAVGVREPKTISIEDADIPDHKTVIGVRVGTESRAYLVDAFRPSLYRPNV